MSSRTTSFAKEVFLLVDDSPDDLLLLKRAFAQVAVDNPTIAVESGQEAIDYLTAAIEPGDRRPLPIPAAILTDLKMPGLNGFELLGWIRSRRALQDVVVIVLSGSDVEKDFALAYELGANIFLTKKSNFPDQVKQVQRLLDFLRKQHGSGAEPGAAASGSVTLLP